MTGAGPPGRRGRARVQARVLRLALSLASGIAAMLGSGCRNAVVEVTSSAEFVDHPRYVSYHSFDMKVNEFDWQGDPGVGFVLNIESDYRHKHLDSLFFRVQARRYTGHAKIEYDWYDWGSGWKAGSLDEDVDSTCVEVAGGAAVGRWGSPKGFLAAWGGVSFFGAPIFDDNDGVVNWDRSFILFIAGTAGAGKRIKSSRWTAMGSTTVKLGGPMNWTSYIDGEVSLVYRTLRIGYFVRAQKFDEMDEFGHTETSHGPFVSARLPF